MESSNRTSGLTFTDLKCRLICTLQRRLDNGEFTERGLARLTSISQPQIHHLLKRERKLNAETADIIMSALQLTVLDLLTTEDTSRVEGQSTSSHNRFAAGRY